MVTAARRLCGPTFESDTRFEDVDVSEVRGSGLLRGAAAVPGPRLAPRLPPVRGVRQGPQPRHTRGGEEEHVIDSWCLSFLSIYILYFISAH